MRRNTLEIGGFAQHAANQLAARLNGWRSYAFWTRRDHFDSAKWALVAYRLDQRLLTAAERDALRAAIEAVAYFEKIENCY